MEDRTYDARVDKLKDLRNEIDELEETASILSKEIVADYVKGDRVEGDYANGTVSSKKITVITPKSLLKALVDVNGETRGMTAFLRCVTVGNKNAERELPATRFAKVAQISDGKPYITTKYK